jgi:hypothetical protein
MARLPTYPTVKEDLLKINVFSFKFKERNVFDGTISIKGLELKFKAVTGSENGIIRITHSASGKSWLIDLIAIKSNLGFGVYYYFVCPKTKVQCKTLYFYQEDFQHRKLIPFNHRKENQARKWRMFQRLLDFESGKVADEMFKPNFRAFYKGKPTKKMLQIEAKINREAEFYNKNIQDLYKFF